MKRTSLQAPVMAGLAVVVAIGLIQAASAQELKKPADGFPDRPLTVIVPYGPGGGADIMTRAWAPPMEKIVGVPVIVVNQPGGGGFAAIPDYMSRPRDGYTILEHDDSLPPGELLGQTKTKVFEELEPVCITNVAFSQLYIRPDEKRFTDWPSFLAYAKANPGKVTVGNVGLEMIQVDLLEEAAGVKLKQLNFDKPAERYASVVGGHADALYEQPGDVISFLDSKQMKPILTFLQGPRVKAFPDAPTLTEIGQGSVTVMSLVRMFWIHKDAPEPRKRYLEAACEIAYKASGFQEFLEKRYLNLAPSYYGSKEASEKLKAMNEVYRTFFKRTGQIK